MSPGVVPHHRHYGDITAIEMFPGVTRRTLVSGANVTLVEIRIAAGSEVPEHAHPHEQAGYVAAGRIVIRPRSRTARSIASGRRCPGARCACMHAACALCMISASRGNDAFDHQC